MRLNCVCTSAFISALMNILIQNSVCLWLSVRPRHSGIPSKRLNISSKFCHRRRQSNFLKNREEGVDRCKPNFKLIFGCCMQKEWCRYLLPFEHNARTWQTNRPRKFRRNRLTAMSPKTGCSCIPITICWHRSTLLTAHRKTNVWRVGH